MGSPTFFIRVPSLNRDEESERLDSLLAGLLTPSLGCRRDPPGLLGFEGTPETVGERHTELFSDVLLEEDGWLLTLSPDRLSLGLFNATE